MLTRLSVQSVWVAFERAKIPLNYLFFRKISSIKKIALFDGVTTPTIQLVKRKHCYQK